jgi:hypothetical protein
MSPPLLRDYRVGIVIPKAGINVAQLAEIGKRLDFIAKTLPADGVVYVYVPGFDLADAEASVVRDLCNMLERKPKVQETYLPEAGDHKAGVATAIVYGLLGDKRCDEIWCCPAEGQTAHSSARVAQVWRLGQMSRFPTRFKQIPPWVEPPVPEAKQKQPTKGKKSWRDMWNKQSFRW